MHPVARCDTDRNTARTIRVGWHRTIIACEQHLSAGVTETKGAITQRRVEPVALNTRSEIFPRVGWVIHPDIVSSRSCETRRAAIRGVRDQTSDGLRYRL